MKTMNNQSIEERAAEYYPYNYDDLYTTTDLKRNAFTEGIRDQAELMKNDAIEFATWLAVKEYQPVFGEGVWVDKERDTVWTEEQLYNEFKDDTAGKE